MGGEMKVRQIGKEMLGNEESIPIDFIQPGFAEIYHFVKVLKLCY